MLPMHAATYRARALACGFGVAKTGTHQIFVTCEILDVDADGNEKPSGEEITWIGSFTDKTTPRTIESLGYFGWTGDNLEELDDPSPERIFELMPSSVDLAVDVEDYEGKQQLRVKWVNAPGGGKFAFKEPLQGSALKSFAAQMRGTIRGARGATGPRAPTPPTRPAQPPSRSNGGARHPNAPAGVDDDLPF